MSFVEKFQRNIFYLGGFISAYALYDLFLDIRFAPNSGYYIKQKDLIVSLKIKVDDIQQFKHKDVLMIDPLTNHYKIVNVQGVPQEMVQMNQNISFMVPDGQFYSNLNANQQERSKLIDLTGFHFLALIKGDPKIRIWPQPGWIK